MSRNKKTGEDNAILGWIYQTYRDNHPTEPDEIKEDFAHLYQAMNGMMLSDMDKVIYPVCTLCTDYERLAFCEGVRVGVQLAMDLGVSCG